MGGPLSASGGADGGAAVTTGETSAATSTGGCPLRAAQLPMVRPRAAAVKSAFTPDVLTLRVAVGFGRG